MGGVIQIVLTRPSDFAQGIIVDGQVESALDCNVVLSPWEAAIVSKKGGFELMRSWNGNGGIVEGTYTAVSFRVT